MICPVEITSDLSALRAARVGDHANHGFLLKGRDGAGNEDTGSNFAGTGEEDHLVPNRRLTLPNPLQRNSNLLQCNSNLAATEFKQLQTLGISELSCSDGMWREVGGCDGILRGQTRRKLSEIQSTLCGIDLQY